MTDTDALTIQPMLHGEVYKIPHRINGTVDGKIVTLRMETEDDARAMHGIIRDVCFGIADVVRVMTPTERMK